MEREGPAEESRAEESRAEGVPPEALETRRVVEQAVRRSGQHRWDLEDVNWDRVRAEELTEDDRTVVRFLTYIEDHIPWYLNFFLDAFPTTDVDLATYARNREYFRFLVMWANDEEKHAAALTRYQVTAEMADEATVLRQLAAEGGKPWDLPYEHPLELYTYAFLQEKATQLFYQRYQRVVREPLLRDLLGKLAADEARHFGLYSHLVANSLATVGPRALDGVKNVLSTFEMPLNGVLDGYWRMALRVVDRVGHDHTEAYDSLGRLVGRFSDQFGTPDVDDLWRLIRDVQRMP
ncbi:acyl-ACP desaturase [Umezawaea beigongshangensis]|uniref:acyl-ACP desaturase n=1 Tax=Umezawaea beigongshangensis TaxID=2780383 RepID=UPI0018F12976|nr:acyl-ACP desaturase [Umezawaea beigongshangensis]